MAAAAPAAGTEVEKYTKQAYYMRYKLLLDEYGTDVLRKMFDKDYPPATLAKDLARSKARMKLDPLILRKTINAEQERLLPPKNGAPSSENFDISLLVILVRNLCSGLDAGAKCWDPKKKPKPGDVTVAADVARIRNARNEMSHGKHVLEKQEFDDRWGTLDLVLQRLSRGIPGLSDLPDKINELKTRNLDVMSSQLRALKSKTPDFFSKYGEEHYVQTEKYRDAKAILEEKRVIILTGHPGEGKTTTAAHLAKNVSDEEKCLILSSPVDWSHVDLELEIFDTIIIDDIFGAGAINQLLVEDWERRLEEVKRATKGKNKLNVIITTRHYILEEAKQTLSRLPMFQDEHTVLLSSDTLSEEEKIEMISSKIQKSERDEIDVRQMREYANQSSLFYGHSFANRAVAFGFPECVDMFVRNDSIYLLGSEFFKNPNAFFKRKLEELYKGEKEEKFFALVLVWVNGGRLPSKDVELLTQSEKIREIAQSFGFAWDRKMIRTVHDALTYHKGGYLNYSESSGIYSFSHNVIGDMVGLVTMQDQFVQSAVIKNCPRDFFMEHVTIGDSEGSEYTVSIKGPRILVMVAKTVSLLTRKDGNTNSNDYHSNDQERVISSIGVCSERVEPKNDLDIGIIRHPAFDNAGFVKAFMDYVVQNNLTKEVFEVPVLSMSGFFFKYGIKMQKENMCLTAYSVLTKADKLVREVIKMKVLSKENKDRYLYLMFATHNEDMKLMSYLLDNDARVTGDTIYIAVHKANIEILATLLDHQNTTKADVNDQGNAVNGNYPLIVAARKGLSKAVQCLVDHRADLAVSNTKNLTALHKAIVYKKEEISEILIKNGAPLDKKGGKFKRTPLHIAADMGQESIVRRLLRKGASTLVKDHRGHYPIHLAAIQGHAGVVKVMIQHDKTQEKLKITSYGKKSFIKGLTVYHVAVWKKHGHVLDELVRLGANPNIGDCYGQTPIFYAIMNKDSLTVRKIIESNVADLQRPHKHGYSPLHFAIHTGQTDIAKMLCPLVNVNAQDRYKKTPLHVAVEKGNARMVTELIRNYRADYRMITKRQDTVFHILERKFKTSPKLRTDLNKIARDIVDFDPSVKDQLKNSENKYGETATIGPINSFEMGGGLLQQHELINRLAGAGFMPSYMDIEDHDDVVDDIYDRTDPFDPQGFGGVDTDDGDDDDMYEIDNDNFGHDW